MTRMIKNEKVMWIQHAGRSASVSSTLILSSDSAKRLLEFVRIFLVKGFFFIILRRGFLKSNIVL